MFSFLFAGWSCGPAQTLEGLLLLLLLGEVVEDRLGNDDSLREIADGLEAHHVGTVLDDLDLASVDVDVSVLALYQAIRISRLQLEGAVGRLVAVGVRAVFIVPACMVTQLMSTD